MPRILVVDDEPLNVDLVRLVLQRQGFDIVAAYNGLDGLTLAEVERVDAIILDMMLPDISGEEFCIRLHSIAAIAHLPIVVLSARSASADKDRAIAAGADYYLTKPANFPELVRQLQRLIMAS